MIYGFNTVASRAAKGATNTIPIVFAPSNDPIGARVWSPIWRILMGNVTGLKLNTAGLPSKRLELLKDGLPVCPALRSSGMQPA